MKAVEKRMVECALARLVRPVLAVKVLEPFEKGQRLVKGAGYSECDGADFSYVLRLRLM